MNKIIKLMIRILKWFRSIAIISWILRTFFMKLGIIFNWIYKSITTHIVVSGCVKIYLPEKKVFKLFSKGDDFIPTQVFWNGYKGYEDSVEIFYYLSKRSKIIFDIGANIGYYSLVAASANSNAKIYAFEPVPRIMERLKKQIKINKFNHVFPEMMVASNKKENIPFYIPKGNTLTLAASTKRGWVKETDEVLIDAITLDEYKQQKKITKIDLIKMDCEFHEYEVLQGMIDILKDDEPAILMEVLMPETEGVKDYFEDNSYILIEEFMQKNGYFSYLIYKGALIKTKHLEFNNFDRNYLFAKYETENVFSLIPNFADEYFSHRLKINQ